MSEKKCKWYENGNVITTILIFTILAAIVCSQSMIGGGGSFSIFSSVLNHNALYFIVLVYFVLLKTKWGKKYFDYLNVFLVALYFVSIITSLLTLIQSFSLNTILEFLMSVLLFVYLFHTMFRDTRIWKEYSLSNSPFNEITNDMFYYTICVLVVVELVVSLIFTVAVAGVFLSILDAFYLLLFGRYIYLYRDYLDSHEIDSHNKGNFDDIKESISQQVDEIKDKVDEVLDHTKIDDTIVDTVKKIKKEVVKDKENHKKGENS